MLTKEVFQAMFAKDLKRKGLTRKAFANEFTMRGETISAVSITYWVKQGYIPPARLRLAIDILGEDSNIAAVPMSDWEETWRQAELRESESKPLQEPSSVREPVIVTEGERMVVRRSLVPVLIADIRRRMPVEYRASFNPPMEDRDLRHIPSYCHNGIASQIVRVRPGNVSKPNLMNAIFKLAVIKAVHGHEAIRAHIVLVVKAPVHPLYEKRTDERYHSEELRDYMIAEYAYDAQALNIQLAVAEDTDHAAQMLLGWATHTISEPIDEDAIEEIDPDEDF